MRCDCLKRSSTPGPKSDGKPTRNFVLGSKSVRGKKNRKNIRRLAPRNAVIEVQIYCRRNFRASGREGRTFSGAGLAAPFTVGLATCAAGAAPDGVTPPDTPTPGFDFVSMDVRCTPSQRWPNPDGPTCKHATSAFTELSRGEIQLIAARWLIQMKRSGGLPDIRE